MKRLLATIGSGLLPFFLLAQVGHIMQGIGATNMSMGGAATAQPIDINGALQWNPAAISAFDTKVISVNAGLFFSSPVLYSTAPTPGGPMSGVTKDDRGISLMPALAMVWGKKTVNIVLECLHLVSVDLALHFPKAIRIQLTCLRTWVVLAVYNQIISYCRLG